MKPFHSRPLPKVDALALAEAIAEDFPDWHAYCDAANGKGLCRVTYLRHGKKAPTPTQKKLVLSFVSGWLRCWMNQHFTKRSE